ncbi:hypothetical protein F4803DRAFT_557228 [Xylaria telfairii]|nr:hypothetical protein F4803DRAFT_557228 [Xylaria telfairii]
MVLSALLSTYQLLSGSPPIPLLRLRLPRPGVKQAGRPAQRQGTRPSQEDSDAEEASLVHGSEVYHLYHGFIPLAEYVAAKATPVPDTESTIDRVITVRTRFGTKLEKHGNVLSELSDVLERVREVLTAFMPAPVANQSASTGDKLSNRLAGRAVYEPSQEVLDAPVPDRPAKPEGDNAVYEAETETTFEHATFALTNVINDMNRGGRLKLSSWTAGINYDTYDIGYGTYLTTYRLLDAFVNVLQPGRLPIYKEGVYGYYDPTSDRSKKTG